MTRSTAWALFAVVALVVAAALALGLTGGRGAAGWAVVTALVVFSAFAVHRRSVRRRSE